MRTKDKSEADTVMAMTIAVATGLLTTACVLMGAAPGTLGETIDTAAIDTHETDGPAPAHPTPEPTSSSHAETPVSPATPQTNKPPESIVSTSSVNSNGSIFADNMTLETPSLSFKASFPNGAHKQPAYQSIMAEMDAYRTSLRADAAAAANAARQEGFEFTPWTIDIGFEETARSGDLISIIGRELADKGGAHPNSDWKGVIADVNTGEELAFTDMFLPRKANSPAFQIGLCEALKSEKIDRIGEASIDGLTMDCGDPEVSRRLARADIALTPSSTDGKFGGATAYFPPYAVGVYAEGPYMATVPQIVFADDLRPEYKALFDGEPR